jgi:hypothetical protein
VDEAGIFGPDERSARASRLAAGGEVRVAESRPSEHRKQRQFRSPRTGAPVVREVVYHDWRLAGEVAGRPVEVVVGETGRIIFGRCGCPFFQEHLLNRGPCEHLLALVEAGEPWRRLEAVNEPPPNDPG